MILCGATSADVDTFLDVILLNERHLTQMSYPRQLTVRPKWIPSRAGQERT